MDAKDEAPEKPWWAQTKEPERLKVVGVPGRPPIWKVVNEAEQSRTVAWCSRQSDAKRILQALQAVPLAEPRPAREMGEE